MSPRSQQQRGHILLVFSNLLNLKKLNYCYRIWKYPKNEAFKIYCQCLHTSNSHVRIVFLPCIVIEEESDRRSGKGRRCCLWSYRNTELVSVLLFIHIFKSSWCGMELNQSPNSSNVIAVSSVWLFSYSMLEVDCRDDVLLQNRHLIKNRHDAFRISKTNTLGVFDILSHFSWISILIKVTNCTQIYKYIHTVQ